MLPKLAVPMPDNLPAALVRRALQVKSVNSEYLAAIDAGKSLVFIGDPLNGAAAAIAVANHHGLAHPMLYTGFIDASKFSRLRFDNTPLVASHSSLDESLSGDQNGACDIIIWTGLSFINDKQAHDIDTALADRMANGLCNLIAGWNTSPERRVSAEELRAFETRATSPTGYPMLNIYANNDEYIVLVSADSVLS